MKKVLFVLSLMVSYCSFGQEIKIKKGKISLDGTEVALLDKKKLVYSISSLDNVPKFSVEIKNDQLLDGSTVYWCVLTDLNTGKTNEIMEEGTYDGLSFEKSIVSSVTQGKYKFITSNGIDEKLVADYINGPQANVAKTFEELNLKVITDLKKEKESLDKAGIRVNKNGTIVQDQDATDKNGNPIKVEVVIGSISKKDEVFIQGFPPSLVYSVYSIYSEMGSNNRKQEKTELVANWYKTKVGYNNPVSGKPIKEQIITKDNKSFNLREVLPNSVAVSLKTSESSGVSVGENDLSKAIVAKLLYNGYTFGNVKKAIE